MTDEIQRIAELPALPPRRADGHKGDYGRVLVVGGSRGMVGAVALAARAALRGGAGLVTFAAPEPVQLAAATLCPCATSLPLSCDENGSLSPAAVSEMLAAADACDVIAVGPGLGVGPQQQTIVRAALEQTKPLVIDADGLNNLAKIDNWPALRRCPLILTPHPGEFSRLTGAPVKQIQASREDSAVAAARDWAGAAENVPPPVCVLKGAGTVVTDGLKVYVNDTGNPGMATGGSGDILTGLTAALLAQGLAPLAAAVLSAWTHGRAGDLAAEQLGQISLVATDLLDHLPRAMQACPGASTDPQ